MPCDVEPEPGHAGGVDPAAGSEASPRAAIVEESDVAVGQPADVVLGAEAPARVTPQTELIALAAEDPADGARPAVDPVHGGRVARGHHDRAAAGGRRLDRVAVEEVPLRRGPRGGLGA